MWSHTAHAAMLGFFGYCTEWMGREETLTGYLSDSSMLREEAEKLSTLFKGTINNTLKITNSFDDVGALGNLN